MIGVILSGGRADSSLCQLFGDIPTGMVPVGGKPILSYILENFVRTGVREVWIAVGSSGRAMGELVGAHFAGKVDVRFVDVDPAGRPGDSLLSVCRRIGRGRVLAACADSYLRLGEEDIACRDAVFTASPVDDPRLWCTVEADAQGRVVAFHDKRPDSPSREALVGVYIIDDVETFCRVAPRREGVEISELFDEYRKHRPVRVHPVAGWLDFGHLVKYQESRKKMLATRHFNSLEFDDLLGTITKRSRNRDKFIDEIRWQESLPERLRVLAPRLLHCDLTSDVPSATMEYYAYSTMAETWLFSSFGFPVLRPILDRVWEVLFLFLHEKRPVSDASYRLMYVDKTEERAAELMRSGGEAARLFEADSCVVNGRRLAGWSRLRDEVFRRVLLLHDPAHDCLIHGDYCFSNILYDINSGVLRLIDSRGRWGEGVSGDIKYDVAKLRHSVAGGYDFIVNDFFRVARDGGGVTYELFVQDRHRQAAAYFDGLVSERFQLEQILLIEGLLFLTMIPLHRDEPSRQLVMLARALESLNAALA